MQLSDFVGNCRGLAFLCVSKNNVALPSDSLGKRQDPIGFREWDPIGSVRPDFVGRRLSDPSGSVPLDFIGRR